MSTATGIHISGNTLRVVHLEKLDNAYYLRGLINQRVSEAFDFDPEKEVSKSFVEELGQALESLPKPIGTLSFCLSGGLYHIQKIPLEVAGEKDRREQIFWEASQALISPVDNSVIDFIAVGRVAFWTAVRNGVIDAHETLCSALGETHLHLSVAPLALFCAGLPARVWEAGRKMAIHSDPDGSCYVAVENGILIGVETTVPNSSSLQRWFSLASSSHRPCKRVYLSGDIPAIDPPASLSLEEYPIFLGIDTAQLPKRDREELGQASRFALALGAGLHKLISETP
ncbi:MAG: hypothetical protein F4Y39_20695 [Gemmatimonadetes bacterium]|nr:hypothetical protein [Gemmatimonadota bacterium]MYK53539.1 hypothetical protein [Gemmatimonadota bacterium]